jgi:hypothetical protein
MNAGNSRPEVERSLALHREVARRLRRDPRLLDRARIRVEIWLENESVDRFWAEAWKEVLDSGLEAVVERLEERSERAHDLRQVSPFAGVLDPRTRWSILKTVSPQGSRA